MVLALRQAGQDVLTSYEAGNANQRIPDEQVLAFATKQARALLTLNRQHFMRLHRRNSNHAGIVACTVDADYPGQAARILAEIAKSTSLSGQLIRVNRPA